ncbi:MAG: LodA/GoxA family CTQ-dependent oxidase [Sulfitobacter sp.]
MTTDDIVSVAIHPAIGIARIGNAPDDWFLAADVRGATPQDADGYRDAEGRIKRQVARFRIYATLKSGDIRELTADEADIEWEVEVGNLKAGWYEYHYPMDLPVKGVTEPAHRNANFDGDDRERFNIRPTPRSISGRKVGGTPYHLDDGKFFGKNVYLGELRTDDKGRLMFFGGHGDSEPLVPGTAPTTFANNEMWHDDTCDGPVRAKVTVGGKVMEATPAHVVVAPPNFGPGLFGVVTMDDVVRDLFMREGWLPKPEVTSFTHDIWPIFDRMTANQWVNDGIFLVAGEGTPLDARNPEVIGRMQDPSDRNADFRNQVFELFRQPGQDRPEALPPFYGDAFGDENPDGSLLDPTRQELLLTDTQYWHLQNWANGAFENDWQSIPTLPEFGSLSPAAQTNELDRAAMHECLGGPFHPGIEITWPFRLAIMWASPYRLNTLPAGEQTRQEYGPKLTVETALSPDGPHGSSGPGSLTRWMGVPWQTDEASCNSGMIYSPQLYLSSPSFWGARVPNQVLSLDAFNLATSPGLTDQQVDRHFSNRHLWLRDINGRGYLPRINAMVSRWWKLGLVEAQVPPDGSPLPNPTFVETGRISGATNDPTLTMVQNSLALDKYDKPDDKLTVALKKPKNPRGYKTFDRGEV